MQLLDFPPEVLHNILFFACLSRGIVRALRLKLVCKTFYDLLNLALFQTRLPDLFLDPSTNDRFSFRILIDWPDKHLCGGKKFWIDYISYRVRMKSNTGDISSQIQGPYTIDLHYVMLWKVVDELRIRVGADFELTLDTLCTPTLRNLIGSKGHPQPNIFDSDIDCCLLGAAAFLGQLPLFKKLEKKKPKWSYDPFVRSVLFPSPLFLAAFSGNIEMWRHLQKKYLSRGWLGEDEIAGSIAGALESDNMDMLREIDTRLNFLRVPSYVVEEHVLSLDAFHFAKEHGAMGEIVDLLMEHGMREYLHSSNAVYKLLEGHLPMVHKLINYGIDINIWHQHWVAFALQLEDTKLLEFMLRRKVCHPILKNTSKEFALKLGMESMAEILQQHIENDPIRYLKRCDVGREAMILDRSLWIWRRWVDQDLRDLCSNKRSSYEYSLDNHIIADDS
ncbi:hypothetical protein F4806DRAFT_502788 [Annulohypoxylon nitens]|nr:hypothetical protein F4806DRAFT_502788 [Annulohypoxylon nitens]